ncbi:sugar porter family MFS transporter [Tengunoibacter tsumagoiensis]|uniref:MFS transporter n=1 Tax=Tengunoibacter tsumagoiensis TaxID=2014871 RepID=A0A402A448_9CHLR|nr:sugar porter family MFS transporter [Tengunoibacter tsumagoiensis]GCE13892.1 MFS transporter [Tengunoibacter tsumagoiensis]
MADSSRPFNNESATRPFPDKPHYAAKVYLIAIVAALGGFLFGYDTGVISGALLYLKQDFALNSTQQEIAVSSVLIGSILGAVAGGRLSDGLGRKMSLIIMGIIFAVGAILSAFAPNFPFFLVCRIILGFGIGASSFLAPMYIAEMAPPSLRGSLVALDQLLITAGISISYFVDLAFAHAGLGWRPMVGVAVIPGLALLIGMLFLTETPRWLAERGRWREAELAMDHLSVEERQTELTAIREALRVNTGGKVKLAEFFQSGLTWALIAGIGLAIFQQLVGINTVIYYAPTIFTFAGFQSASSAILATSVVGAVNFFTTLLAVFIIDRVGRRPLLLGGLVGIIISLIVMGFIFLTGASNTGTLVLIALLVYIFSFAIGLGPVFWLMSSEIFPTRVRASGAAISTFFNWTFNFLISVTFLSLVNAIGISSTFWLYAVFAVIAFAFCWYVIPETKGRTLEDIESFWKNDRKWEPAPTERRLAHD